MSNKNLKWSDPHSKPVESAHAFGQVVYEGSARVDCPREDEPPQEWLLRRTNENLRAAGLGR